MGYFNCWAVTVVLLAIYRCLYAAYWIAGQRSSVHFEHGITHLIRCLWFIHPCQHGDARPTCQLLHMLLTAYYSDAKIAHFLRCRHLLTEKVQFSVRIIENRFSNRHSRKQIWLPLAALCCMACCWPRLVDCWNVFKPFVTLTWQRGDVDNCEERSAIIEDLLSCVGNETCCR